MTRLCDGAPGNKPCPRRNTCEGDCHFNVAEITADITARYEFPLGDRALCWAIWGMVAVVLCLALVPIVWLIGVLL
jgi:hypothetical protein